MDFGYLQDLDTQDDDTSTFGSRLAFQFQPEGLSNSHDSGMKTTMVPGHSHGLPQFGGGGEDVWPVTLRLINDDPDPSWVNDRVEFLKSGTFPEFDGNDQLARAPHTFLWVIGQWRNERVKIFSFKATFGPTYDPKTRFPRQATVELQLRRFGAEALDYRNFRP